MSAKPHCWAHIELEPTPCPCKCGDHHCADCQRRCWYGTRFPTETCFLYAGHFGPHVGTPDEQIVVSFKEPQ